jgi:hypothetical protein
MKWDQEMYLLNVESLKLTLGLFLLYRRICELRY